MIALFGAAGAIGQSIAAALAAQRQPYRVVGRSREALSSTFSHDPRAEVATTFKGHMRKAQEDLLLSAHAEGRIAASVLRLPDFYGPGVDKSFLHSAFLAAVNGGVANLIGPIDQPHEFVFVPDVGPVVARLVETPAAQGRVWHLAGAGVTTQRAIVEQIEQQVGYPIRVRVAGKTMLRLIGLFNPLMREMVEMHYLLTDPLLMDDGALQGLIGPLHKTPYAEGVRRCLAAVRGGPGSY